ncbi:uncharacterized protein LOC130743990 [Lotus japonicus]|uniref:uncharacterized protein LOC130743990 n=1 Tax=Lotus japonicus TaxID=34305 RepID=UPI00258E8239|nr:uncharacterized protein LOC130743990 [Lotus japonicus]
MRILAWNCRGLGNRRAVRAFKMLIHSEAPDVCFISETRLFTAEMLRQRGAGGLFNIFPVQCAGARHSRAGGLCLFWRDGIDVGIISSSLNHIRFSVTDADSHAYMECVAVYGFPEERNKRRTWEMIQRLKPADSIPWCCFGDFNDILSPDDKLGGDPPDVGRLQEHALLRRECGLNEVNYSGNRFTWSNNRHPGNIEERLDYAIVNKAWEELWPVTSVYNRTRYKSDHSPILVYCGNRKRRVEKKREMRFRFEELWLQQGEACREVVDGVWGRPSLGITQKITAVGEALDSWGRNVFGDIPKKISEARVLLQRLQRRVPTQEVLDEIRATERELDVLLEHEEIMWSQRSRATWLRHGDRNSRFFHQKASQRRRRNMIEFIQDANGREVETDEEIVHVLLSYFQDLFTCSNPSGIEEAVALVANRVSPAHRETLLAAFSREDIEEALFQMHPTKAPGADGLPALFYQKIWAIIGDDVSHFCLQVLQGNIDPGIVNQTLLVLIPKIKIPEHASQFRPISLCNVIFKIITKCIANRLKIILPDLICESQSAFVPGRLITDNALIAFECFHFMKKRIQSRNGIMALKLDMSKAYDRVEWPFLQSVMTSMGFPLCWVNLIMRCVSSVSFSILLNGNRQAPFAPHRGLRQGDPLLPYLFILCGEVFSAMINKAVLNSSLHGVKISRSAPVISHLLFADDSVIFARADVQEAECIRNILSSYERASGQAINLDKSMLSVSRNVPQNFFHELRQLLGVKAVESFDKYLGLPTIIGKSKSQIFHFVKERVWKKLKGWKERSLSRAGREVLVKAVVQAIPAYVMSCFVLPDGLCDQIEGMISKFYWGGDVSKRSLHWVSWDKLCRAKDEGGLGFRDFKSFNLALVAKNWWRIYHFPNSLFSRVFKAVYFPSGELRGAKRGYRPSYAWSSILKSSRIFKRGGRWRLGNGQSVNILHDAWLPNGAPLVYRQDLFEELHLKMVSDLLVNGRWNVSLVEMVFNPASAAVILAVPLPIQSCVDRLFWPGSPDGWYTSKSGYEFLRLENRSLLASSSTAAVVPGPFWTQVWKAHSLPRCKEVMWRACAGYLPVRTALRRRGLDVDPSCPWCGLEEETEVHVLLSCPVIQRIWFAIMGLGVTEDAPLHVVVARMWDGVCETVVYVIWEARNALLFQNRELSLDHVLARVASLEALPRPGALQRSPRAEAAAWSRPAVGWIKVNVDASVRRAMAGFGMVARDEEGALLAAATLAPVMMQSAGLAEALCLRWAMRLALDLGFFSVCFETDSLQLYQWWRRRTRGSSYLDLIISDCRTLALSFANIDVLFVRRSGNRAADFLARGASSFLVWIEEGPPGLDAFVTSDAMASMPV